MLGSERGSGMIWWVIILVILVVVAGVLAYTFQADLQEAQGTIKSLNEEVGKQRTTLAERISEFSALADVVGFAGESVDSRKPEISAIKTRIGGLNTKYPDIQDSDATLEKLLVRFDDMVAADQGKYSDVQANLATAQAAERSAHDLATSTATEKDKTIAQLQGDVKAEQNRGSENAKKSQDTIDALRNQVSELEAQQQKLAADAKKEKNLLENMILAREAKIREIEDRNHLVREKDTSDGEVVDVSISTGIGYINAGFRQGIKPGMRFKVFEYLKGGEKHWKGELQVREVEEGMSSANILSSLDFANPVKKGDQISSPIYDRDRPPVFAFVGELTGRYSKDELTRLLAMQGAHVASSVSVDVDFLVVGAKSDAPEAVDIEATPEFVLAREYGADIISVRELESMLQF